MINSIIGLHSYLVLNGAIAIGFIISRFILYLPFFRQKVLQIQRLKFARYSFFTTIVLFFLMPNILDIIPSTYYTNFQFEPILKNASVDFLQHHNIINQLGSAQSFFSVNIFLMTIFFVGFGLFFAKYINSLFILNRIRQDSFCQHKINNVNILFSPSAEIPFCWSLLKNHFIVIPNTYLEKHDDLKLGIRHELQHIRQGDTYWLHFLILIKSVCFWNPFMKLWINWLDELQEFSCDEAIVLRKKTSPNLYAQCLVNAASESLKNVSLPQAALGINGVSISILQRRVTMLFSYDNIKSKRWPLIVTYIIACFMSISITYAFNGSTSIAGNKQIACPSAELIKESWQKLDNVSVINSKKFAVWSLNSIKIGNYSWHIQSYATAKDLNAALIIGQDNVKQVTEQRNKFAIDTKDVYLCSYLPTVKGMGVAATSFKNEEAFSKITHVKERSSHV